MGNQMFTRLYGRKGAQVSLGLLTGIAFGFLLQKGGVTDYDVIIGQLLLTDFTVIKVMLAAVIVGMPGFHTLRHLGYVRSHAAEGSFGSNVIGGLIFGAGFAVLGYCPGTVAGAVGTGALDALFGGVVGILIGSALFVELFPRIRKNFLAWGQFPVVTIPELLKVNVWVVIILTEVGMTGFLVVLEYLGL
jgi:hypothetical protein